MVEELRTALTSGQLVVYYQPKVDLANGQVHDVEALVRWEHPTRGLLFPDSFLGVVEEAGLMHAMTRVMLGIALDQAAQWQAGGQQLTIAVNLSASSLVDTDLPDEVAAMLAARGVCPEALQLEVTEEFLMADRDRARDILTRLGRHGIQIALDDSAVRSCWSVEHRAYPMSSVVIAHLLQLGRPDAAPRIPATAEAASRTPPLSHGPRQDPPANASRVAPLVVEADIGGALTSSKWSPIEGGHSCARSLAGRRLRHRLCRCRGGRAGCRTTSCGSSAGAGPGPATERPAGS